MLYRNSLDAIARLPHKNYDRAQLILFAGKREHGKTTALRGYVETREPRVFILDPFGDFESVRLRVDPETALADMASTEGAMRRRITPPIDLESREFSSWLFNEMVDGENPLRDCLLVLDEMSLWSGAIETQELRTLILQGRRLGIRIAAACQRISLVPGVMLSEMTELVLFRMTRPRDLKVVAEWTDDSVAEICPKLQVGACFVVNL
jgi:hypothetical protein